MEVLVRLQEERIFVKLKETKWCRIKKTNTKTGKTEIIWKNVSHWKDNIDPAGRKFKLLERLYLRDKPRLISTLINNNKK